MDTGPEVAAAATGLLDAVDPTPGVRLLGVSVSGLGAGAAGRLRLDAAPGPAWGTACRAIDEVRRRYGESAVGPAALLGPSGARPRRPGDDRWGPKGWTAALPARCWRTGLARRWA